MIQRGGPVLDDGWHRRSRGQADALKDATELLNGAAKWLIGALGAIGAVLIAGSQLSSIVSLPLGPRLVLALAGWGSGSRQSCGPSGRGWTCWHPTGTPSDSWQQSGTRPGPEKARGWPTVGAVAGMPSRTGLPATRSTSPATTRPDSCGSGGSCEGQLER